MKVLARHAVLAIGIAGLAAGACGGDDSSPSSSPASSQSVAGRVAGSAAGSVVGAVTVFAAASLTESFTELGEAFAAAHPDAEVTYNFASSSDLVAQIVEGAPADVYASADQANMAKLIDAGAVAGPPAVFATNSLQIAVEPGNPRAITELADLADPDLVVVTCDPEVPIGAYTQAVLANAGVEVTPDSFEEDVKAVLNKVALGEADAGVVYATDVIAAGDTVAGVEIPADVNVTPEYPITATTAAPNPSGAAAFVELVRSAEGQAILARHGFGSP